MLRRGRRPTFVRLAVLQQICFDDWRQGALDLLRAIPQLSGRPGEGVACVWLPADFVSPSTAALITAAFANLARLELYDTVRLSPDASHEAARGLALLLGTASGPDGSSASAGASGEGTASGPGGSEGARQGGGGLSLLARPSVLVLDRYHLGRSMDWAAWRGPGFGDAGKLKSLPVGFGPVLRQATQLRTLEVKTLKLCVNNQQRPDGAGRAPAEELASIIQLTALSLHSCNPTLLPVLTGALTRLTSLELTDQQDPLPAALFAPLQGLQRLEVPNATLEVPGFAEALSSLTRLSVGGFTLPAQQLSQPLTSIPRWRLPAGLREVGLGTGSLRRYGAPRIVPLEVLAGVEVPAGLRFDRQSIVESFMLYPGRHTAPPVEEDGFAGTELLPAAEEALCGALRFVGRHGLLADRRPGYLSITYKASGTERLLQPVGGATGTGPGRPNHCRWLREVGALGPWSLMLVGFELSYQDVEEMRDSLRHAQSWGGFRPGSGGFGEPGCRPVRPGSANPTPNLRDRVWTHEKPAR
ncbi:hypothetical protein HYH03_001152 [Edaphochlamys debaryana]|uniref:Uncharacterized protein n=1 Tax=Edaphochlamys debaryana TaxID=47281 RepID=A0A835YEF0_9CHLO|nr:hypothetical protein HYH03_001152 [Edaphochlamys debaryana]|eukprot:KAG2501362.1 hypothetical protein HYH03_001152 [Edaphochlamys debaryana]